MSTVLPISMLVPGTPGRLSCRGSFEQACACLHKLNDLLTAAKQPFEFKIISESDPFRLALYDIDPHVQDGDLTDGCREMAALTPTQATHLRDVFLNAGFRAHTLQLWEHVDFSPNQSCRDIYLREESPQTVRIFLHGLTCDIIDAEHNRLRSAFVMMPKVA